MYKILGLKENIKNLVYVAKPFLGVGRSKEDIKKAYNCFILKSQPNVPKNNTDTISFLYKPSEIQQLLKIFEEDSVLDDFEEIFDSKDHLEYETPITKVKEALEQLKIIDHSFYQLILLVINIIFSAPSKLAGGGSSSAAIGCIWVNLRNHWQIQDIIEFLVHETTHNLVFLDELCYTHYNNYSDLPKKENYSWSAILNKPRPLDKVFHSIIVSTEVLTFLEEYLGHPEKTYLHPPTEIMLNQTKHSINYLNQNNHLKNLLSPRANTLLKIYEQKLEAISFQTNSEACAI